MKIVQKNNRQLRVADDRVNEFLNAGYQEIDQKTGKPIVKEPADETRALKRKVAALEKENAALRERLEKLSQQ